MKERRSWTGGMFGVAGIYLSAVMVTLSSAGEMTAPELKETSHSLSLALDNTDLVFTTDGEPPWKVVSDASAYGGFSAQTSNVNQAHSSWIETSAQGPGLLRFSWKVSSENFFDRLSLLVNDEFRASIWGEKPWEIQTFDIPKGLHTLRWEYSNYRDGTPSQNAAWLDNVRFGRIAEWVQRGGPPPRMSYGMACDSTRNRIVLFGGLGEQYEDKDETWEWDGVNWTHVASDGPCARFMHAMTFDSTRNRIVLFGGRNEKGTIFNDTWEWDGTRWTQMATTGPDGRSTFSMVYDSARDRTVLFGGSNDYRLFADTWEWDGVNWTQVATSGPGARSSFAMAYDSVRNRTVLFGGYNGDNYLGDTWEWDGVNWSQVATTGPEARCCPAIAYDSVRNRTVLFGGYCDDQPFDDTWEWDGVKWTLSAPVEQSGFGGRGHVMVYHNVRQHIVLYKGLSDWNSFISMWEWDGVRWKIIPGNPSERSSHSMAYDSARKCTVLFGGYAYQDNFLNYQKLGDTWEWDGAGWTQAATTGPTARDDHAMAYDSVRNCTVLFGGYNGNNYLGDTWEWDGAGWTQAATTGPRARVGHAIAYDSARNCIVLFGGYFFDGKRNYLDDTWEWDGAKWTQVATSGPGARSNHAIVFDSARKRTVLFGMAEDNYRFDYMWEWDGKSWTLVAITGPSARLNHAMVYDNNRNSIILFGGENYAFKGDTWEYMIPSGAINPNILFGDIRQTLLGIKVPNSSLDLSNDSIVDSADLLWSLR